MTSTTTDRRAADGLTFRPEPSVEQQGGMTHRQILSALSGMLLAMFVAFLSVGAVMAVATVGGPLIGGLLVDTSWLGWRWCFYVGVPFGAVALVLLQRTLHLPVVRRKVSIDYLGAAFLSAGVSALLIWVTLAGGSFAWVSLESAVFVAGGGLAIVAFVVTELRVAEPIVPLRLFRDRTTTLAIVASVAIGVAMFGSTVFLGQYLQISRGYSPTAAGLLTIPMVGGLLVSSTVSGILISRYGRWKAYLVAGSVLVAAGFGLLATIDHATDMVLLGVFLAVLGTGIGMTMQNLVLAVQNTVAAADLGAASSAVAFFRSLGGTIGVSVPGAVLSGRVGTLIQQGLADAPGAPAVPGDGDGGLADLADAPPELRELIAVSYGDATGRIFLIAAVLSIITIVAIMLIREVALRTESGDQRLQATAAGCNSDRDTTAAVDDQLTART